MVNYRRNYLPGGTFFFTLTLQNRKSCLLVDHIHLLKLAIQKVKEIHPFQIKSYVVLPEHLHMMWELPPEDADYSKRWKKIKAYFSKAVYRLGITPPKTKHNEIRLWQRRFWEHTIR